MKAINHARKNHVRRGFTLVEVMIYLALFGLLIGGAMVSAYQVLSGGAHIEQAVTIQEEGTFLDRKINWEITQAASASVVGSTLVLEPGHVIFAQNNGRMTLSRAGGDPLPLSSLTLDVGTTTFVVTPGTGGKPTSVQARYAIEGVPFVFARYLRD